MPFRKPVFIHEYGYILKGSSGPACANAVCVPDSAFNSLLANIHDESSDADLHQFLKLTTYKRKSALKVQNYVGVVQTPCGTQIEILPKLSTDTSEETARYILMKMLRTLRDSPFKQAGKAYIYDARMPLLEVYITQFLGLVNKLVKRGVRSDYISIQKNAKYLKGRLLVSQQIRKNAFHQERFYIVYEEYQINRPANRLIKTALQLVNRITRNSRNQRLAREFGFVFEEVPSSADVDADFKQVKTDRTMGYYREVLDWCRLLLHGQGPTASVGDFNTLSLLYPMERLFEDYVAHCIRKDMGDYFDQGSVLKTQVRKYYLVEDHINKPIFNLRPDLLVVNSRQTTCVMDTKWKLLSSKDRKNKYGISQADIYQLYAYGHKYLKGAGQKELMLIYPKTDCFHEPLKPFTYEDGFVLHVVPFDLEKGRLLL